MWRPESIFWINLRKEQSKTYYPIKNYGRRSHLRGKRQMYVYYYTKSIEQKDTERELTILYVRGHVNEVLSRRTNSDFISQLRRVASNMRDIRNS